MFAADAFAASYISVPPKTFEKSGTCDAEGQMKTTLDLDDRILRAAKLRADETGQTLSQLMENALRDHLATANSGSGDFRLQLLIKHGQPVPGVTVDDRDALHEKMEGGD